MVFMRKNFYQYGLLLVSLTTGCSLILGNIKPTDEKSSAYSYLDLSARSQHWIKTREEIGLGRTEKTDLDQSDVTFKAKQTKATISVNSVCKKSKKNHKQSDLKNTARELLLGFGKLKVISEKRSQVSQQEAYEMTVQGIMNHSLLMMRVVLFEKNSCSYDLIYVSDPQDFRRHEDDFERFVASFEVKS